MYDDGYGKESGSMAHVGLDTVKLKHHLCLLLPHVLVNPRQE